MSFSKRLKEARELKGLKQSELAELIGVKNTSVSNYEKGVSYPHVDTLYKIFEILETEPNFLFQDEMHSVKPDMLSFFEKDIINKYRNLDKYGKEAIENLLNIEAKRIDDFKKTRRK